MVTLGYGPRTIWHDCTLMVWSNNSQDSMGTPCGARTGIVRAPHENLQCFSYPTGPVRGPCGTRKGAVRQPYGHVNLGIDTTRIGKTPARASYLTVRDPYGRRRGCSRAVLQYINSYGARKLIMHALKLYGPRTGRQNSDGPVSGRTIFVQNSPGTARTGPGSVMWLRH